MSGEFDYTAQQEQEMNDGSMPMNDPRILCANAVALEAMGCGHTASLGAERTGSAFVR